MRAIRSVSSELPPLTLNTVLCHHQDLQLVSSIDVTLCRRSESSVHQLHCRVNAKRRLLTVFGVVVAGDLGIQKWQDHVSSATLCQGLIGTVATDSIVSVNDSFSVLIDASNEVEGVVGEEAASVQSFGHEMSD